MKIIFEPLKSAEIPELNNSDSLYICDFRALGESFEYEIPAMWKYENLTPWIISQGYAAVNEDYQDIHYKFKKKLVIAKKDKSPKISLINRVANNNHFKKLEVSNVYTFVPHPDIDNICRQFNLHLNYSYRTFQKFNNKIAQKRLFKNSTPNWEVVNRDSLIKQLDEHKRFFIKRSYGFGGYSVIVSEDVDPNKIDFENHEWYIESFEIGEPMSFQCYKRDNCYTVFGFCSQIIENNKNFIGGKVLNYNETLKDTYLKEAINEFIANLDNLIKEYNGFLGVDFLYNKSTNKINFLESNVRLTAMTIPTLLSNDINNSKSAVFHEDLTSPRNTRDSLKIAIDTYDNTYDLLEFI